MEENKTWKRAGEIKIQHGSENLIKVLQDAGYNLIIAQETYMWTRYLIDEVCDNETE